MRELIKKILREQFENNKRTPEEAMIYVKDRIKDLETNHGETLSKYFKMKLDFDKVNYLSNFQYKLGLEKVKEKHYYYYVNVPFPFTGPTNDKLKTTKVWIGSQDMVDSMEPSEKDIFIRNKIITKLLNKYPLNNSVV
jgi:hypothetical protein